jgi:glycosyltransferase involved in cell wall biosynthesis
MKPAIAVIMTVHNGARFLLAALGSILDQTLTDLELVVVDDGSADDTPRIPRSFVDRRIHVNRLRSRVGPFAATHRAHDVPCANLVARMDADDVAKRDRLAQQKRFSDEHPDVDLLWSQAHVISEHGELLRLWEVPLEPLAIEGMAMLQIPVVHSTVVFRRQRFFSMGGEAALHHAYTGYLRQRSRLVVRIPP